MSHHTPQTAKLLIGIERWRLSFICLLLVLNWGFGFPSQLCDWVGGCEAEYVIRIDNLLVSPAGFFLMSPRAGAQLPPPD